MITDVKTSYTRIIHNSTKILTLVVFSLFIVGSFSVIEAFADDYYNHGHGASLFINGTELIIHGHAHTSYDINAVNDDEIEPGCGVRSNNLDFNYSMTVTDVYGNPDVNNYHKSVGDARYESTNINEVSDPIRFNNGYHLKITCEISEKNNPDNVATAEHIVGRYVEAQAESLGFDDNDKEEFNLSCYYNELPFTVKQVQYTISNINPDGSVYGEPKIVTVPKGTTSDVGVTFFKDYDIRLDCLYATEDGETLSDSLVIEQNIKYNPPGENKKPELNDGMKAIFTITDVEKREFSATCEDLVLEPLWAIGPIGMTVYSVSHDDDTEKLLGMYPYNINHTIENLILPDNSSAKLYCLYTDNFTSDGNGNSKVREVIALEDLFPETLKMDNIDDNRRSCIDCFPPTLGVDENNKRVVDDGFSYNGNSVPVKFWHTPFPLITAQVGEVNKVEIIVYDDAGVSLMNNIQFGLGASNIGIPVANVEVLIDVLFESSNTSLGIKVSDIQILDEDNLINNDSVTADISTVNCTTDSITDLCLKLDLEYSYREAPLDNILLVAATDGNGNTQNFFFNEGVQVNGESLNESPTFEMFNKQTQEQTEDIYLTLIRTDKSNSIWEDKYGVEYLKVSEYRFNEIIPTD